MSLLATGLTASAGALAGGGVVVAADIIREEVRLRRVLGDWRTELAQMLDDIEGEMEANEHRLEHIYRAYSPGDFTYTDTPPNTEIFDAVRESYLELEYDEDRKRDLLRVYGKVGEFRDEMLPEPNGRHLTFPLSEGFDKFDHEEAEDYLFKKEAIRKQANFVKNNIFDIPDDDWKEIDEGRLRLHIERSLL